MEPEVVADCECECAEGPLWHPDEQRLYWVDIGPGRIYRYDPSTGRHELCHEGDGPIGGFTIQNDGSLLLFMGKTRICSWREGTVNTLVDGIPGAEENRFNDVVADPAGRVFCGTMPHRGRPGSLYRLDADGRIHLMVKKVVGSNGLGFSPDRSLLYYADSLDQVIFVFDYDTQTGHLADQRVFVSIPKEQGHPDGLTVDAEGCIWLAVCGGSCLARYRPDGTEERRVELPTRMVTSLTFGGPDYGDIYATTAGGTNRARVGPLAGALLRLNAGVRGVPEFRSRIGL